jgi:putative endonuclease
VRTKQPAVYILASDRNGTLYIGVTSDLVDGFSKKYGAHNLVYFDLYAMMEDAIFREKQLKKWERRWKIELIEKNNPYWRDLYAEILDDAKA